MTKALPIVIYISASSIIPFSLYQRGLVYQAALFFLLFCVMGIWFYIVPWMSRRKLYRETPLSDDEFVSSVAKITDDPTILEEARRERLIAARLVISRAVRIRPEYLFPNQTLEDYLHYEGPTGSLALDELIDDLNWSIDDGPLGTTSIAEIVRRCESRVP